MMNDDTAETIDSTNRSAGMPTVRPRGKRSRNSTASSRAESEFAAAVDLALQEYRSVILEAAKAGHPPLLKSNPLSLRFEWCFCNEAAP